MVSAKDAFNDTWRSYRIQQGDDAASLPDPLGRASSRKRRKANPQSVDVDVNADSGGGFFVEEQEQDVIEETLESSTSNTDVQYIPLSSIPDALAILSLPSNDEFILSLFAQTAIYIQTDARRRRRPVNSEGGTAGDEKMVSLRDFERVVEVLLEANTGDKAKTTDEDDGEEDEDEEISTHPSSSRRRPVRAAASTANERRKNQIQVEETEVQSSEEDEYHSIDLAAEDEEDYEEEDSQVQSNSKRTIRLTKKSKDKGSPQKSASGGMRRSRKSKRADDTTATDEEDEEDEGHLSATQRRTVHAAFSLFTSKLRELKGESLDDQMRLGKDDVKLLVANVGEKISDKDVEEMVEEGVRFFAKASSRDITRQTAKLRREAAAGRSTARGEVNRTHTVGIDEFAGILLKGRLI